LRRGRRGILLGGLEPDRRAATGILCGFAAAWRLSTYARRVECYTAGAEFGAENGGGAGVRLRKPKPPAISVEDLNASNDE
jgi:hypothetical protein